MDKLRIEPTIFFLEKISFSLKLFSGHFYGQSFIKTVRGPLKIVYIICFCLIYLSVFGAETIKSDERSNRYFGHMLVSLFYQDNVGTSI